MSDDAGVPAPPSIDDWLGAAGFIDAELDAAEWVDQVDDAEREDPWADVVIDLPTLTVAQRQYLLGGNGVPGMATADDIRAADVEIIDIPTDPNDVEPFDPPAH